MIQMKSCCGFDHVLRGGLLHRRQSEQPLYHFVCPSPPLIYNPNLFQNFPQFVVIYTVKGFGVVNETEVEVLWNSLAFLMIQWMLAY